MFITFVDQPLTDGEYESGLLEIGRIGYSHVELKDSRIRTFGVDAINRFLKQAGLSAIQINTYFDVVHGPEAIEKSVALNREMIGYAARLGIPILRVFTGPLGAAGLPSAKATPDLWRQASAGLQRLCDEGKQAGLAYYVETHPGTLADTTPSILKLLELVDRPNFGVNLQIPLQGEPDVYETTRRLAPHVRHTHLNNFDASGHNTFLDEGIYDIRREISILRDAGFDGSLSVEHAYHHKPALETARREYAFLRKIVDAL